MGNIIPLDPMLLAQQREREVAAEEERKASLRKIVSEAHFIFGVALMKNGSDIVMLPKLKIGDRVFEVEGNEALVMAACSHLSDKFKSLEIARIVADLLTSGGEHFGGNGEVSVGAEDDGDGEESGDGLSDPDS